MTTVLDYYPKSFREFQILVRTFTEETEDVGSFDWLKYDKGSSEVSRMMGKGVEHRIR